MEKGDFFSFFAHVNVAIIWRQQKYAKKQKQKVGSKSRFKQYISTLTRCMLDSL